MKLFIALLPDPDLEYMLCEAQSKSLTDSTWSKVPEMNLHMTLAYLGQCTAAALPSLENLLDRLTLPWELYAEGKGSFVLLPQDSLKVCAFAWESLPEISAVQKNLAAELRKMGQIIRSSFIPHVSLWKIPEGASLTLPPNPKAALMGGFKSIALMRSQAGAHGPVYKILHERSLGHESDLED